MFGTRKPVISITRTLVGEWRAETISGDVRGVITATFNSDGTFLTRNQLDRRGIPADPVTQVGRYRVEPLDKLRFRLFTVDENGAPMSSTVRSFVDKDTMVNEVGNITFHRAPAPETADMPVEPLRF